MTTFSITRSFNAPKDLVFQAFSTEAAMSEWWGPVGMDISVKSFDFRPGGKFHYKMEGKGQIMWGLFIYASINAPDSIEFVNSFSDEAGNICKPPFAIDFPLEIFNRLSFHENNGITTITLKGYPLRSTTAQDTVYQSMFGSMNQGFSGTFDQLEKYLESKLLLRKELKTNNKARTTTYLNFPGNTEDAFNFYKDVFKTAFHGKGIQRFGDVQGVEGMPPLSEADKKLILHIELPITGGHILMATDAPETMGFKLNQGNNMHVNIEPETKEETKRLFDALSEAGVVTMPLQDMFWGAYFGSCTDKYGINWMFSYNNVE